MPWATDYSSVKTLEPHTLFCGAPASGTVSSWDVWAGQGSLWFCADHVPLAFMETSMGSGVRLTAGCGAASADGRSEICIKTVFPQGVPQGVPRWH